MTKGKIADALAMSGVADIDLDSAIPRRRDVPRRSLLALLKTLEPIEEEFSEITDPKPDQVS